jgi:hypothetical protein
MYKKDSLPLLSARLYALKNAFTIKLVLIKSDIRQFYEKYFWDFWCHLCQKILTVSPTCTAAWRTL